MKLMAEVTGNPVTLYARDGLRLWDPFTARLPLFAPLLENQDYIEAVLPWNKEAVDYDTCFFRDDGLPFGETLAARQAQWLRMSPDLRNPWLKTYKRLRSAPIIINRSSRYHNHFFPWRELVEAFAKDMAFIGHPNEHEAFRQEFGYVRYLPTETLLEAAEAIAESELFIGNQSSCCAIAEGLKHDLIQETDLSSPDCIYPRPNATHCHNGELDFTACGKRFTSKNRMFVRAHLNETPPGGWRIKIGEHEANSYGLNLALDEITDKLRRAGMEAPKNLKEIIIEQNSVAHLNHPVARLKAQLGAA